MIALEFVKQVRTGDCLLVDGNAFYSGGIEHWTLSRHSHAAGVVWTGGALYVVESLEPQGVRKTLCRDFLEERWGRNEIVHWYSLEDGHMDRERIAARWEARLGERYSSWLQFAWSFGSVGSRIRRFLHLPAALNPARTFCSWFVAEAYMDEGYEPNEGDPKEAALVAPEDLAEFTCLRHRGPIWPA